MIKFGEGFSPGSLLNQYQTYQGNPCGVYPDLSSFTGSGVYRDLSSFTGSGVYADLSSFTGSGVIQTSVACIKRSAPTQVHIIWYQSFGSWYRFYPILSYPIFFFFVICLGLCFCPCSVICVLVLVLVLVTFLFLFLVSFKLCVKKKKNCLSSCFLFLCLSYCILSFLHNFCFSLFEFCLG